MRTSAALIGTAALAIVGLLTAAIDKPDTSASAMPAGNYVLDPRHASLVARVKHQGFSFYTLRFTGLDAGFGYDPAHPEASKLSVKIAADSIDTATGADPFGKAFNTELLAADWLDAKRFPTISFTSASIDLGDGHIGKVTGDLTLHGITKPVTLDVTFNGSGKGIPGGETRAGFSATTVIKRSDFGVTKYVPVIGDEVQLAIEAEFKKK
ncbi:YceI family protein [Sphingomonas sp.]|uniref:YceI family protein n=1 Tax=Sphingomonas sp. TaxID=28214 RepID=UPI003D6D740E